MNTQLEKLFVQYWFSLKDKSDFLQIYNLLPDFKKVAVVENFERIAWEIQALRTDLHREQEILFGEALESIELQLEKKQKLKIQETTKGSIEFLRNSF